MLEFVELTPNLAIYTLCVRACVCVTGLDIEQMFLKELKEFSDGELTMSFTTVPVDLEVRSKVISNKKKTFYHLVSLI